MNYKDYFKKLEDDVEYKETKEELGLLLEIADEILRLRIKKGWSQSELAQHAGTKQANISRFESGLSNPSIKVLQKLAAALDAQVVIRFESIQETTTDSLVIYAPHWPTKARLSSGENPASYDVTRASF